MTWQIFLNVFVNKKPIKIKKKNNYCNNIEYNVLN